MSAGTRFASAFGLPLTEPNFNCTHIAGRVAQYNARDF
jgi:hypothetical protein